MNVWDGLLIGVIAAAAGLAVRSAIRRRKKGGCGCGCDGCTKTRKPCDKNE